MSIFLVIRGRAAVAVQDRYASLHLFALSLPLQAGSQHGA